MGDSNDPFMRYKDAGAGVQGRTKVQNRPNVQQLKLIGQSHPTGLTLNLLKLFEPRPPLEYKPPTEKRKCPSYSGMAQFVSQFAEPGQPEYAPPVQKGETPAQKKARILKLRLEKGATKAAEELQKYDPSKDPNISGDPYKTLFVSRLNYETTERRIKREFEAYGPIKRVQLITDKETNKPRGYAFIEYMHTRDMKTAYKQADGKKLDNRRVLVDVERGRTVPNWRPRRLGGGLGSTRVGGDEVNQKHSGREQQQIASGGPTRSEEPKVQVDRYHDRDREKSQERGRGSREKSRERGRDKEREREKLHERAHDRIRDRDLREDRHHHEHRDRDRYRDRDRASDRGRDRERIHSRDKERHRGRDYELERDRDRPRERESDNDRASHEKDRAYPRGRDIEYDHLEPAHRKEQPSVREDNEPIKHGRERDNDHCEQPRNQQYDRPRSHGFDRYQEPEYYDRDPNDKSHHDGFQSQFDRVDPEPPEEGEAIEEQDYVYQRPERSLSLECRD